MRHARHIPKHRDPEPIVPCDCDSFADPGQALEPHQRRINGYTHASDCRRVLERDRRLRRGQGGSRTPAQLAAHARALGGVDA